MALIAIGVGVGVSLSNKNRKSNGGSNNSTSGNNNGSNNSSNPVHQNDPNDPSSFTKDPKLKQSFYGMAYTPNGALYPNCNATLADVITDVQIMSQLTKVSLRDDLPRPTTPVDMPSAGGYFWVVWELESDAPTLHVQL